jgi:hypothetical protein
VRHYQETIDLTLSSGLSPFEFGALFGADPQEQFDQPIGCYWSSLNLIKTAFRKRLKPHSTV